MQHLTRFVVRTAAGSIAVLLSLPVSAQPAAEASGTNEGVMGPVLRVPSSWHGGMARDLTNTSSGTVHVGPPAQETPAPRRLRVVRTAAVLDRPAHEASVVGMVSPDQVLELLDEREGWYLVRRPDNTAPAAWRTGWIGRGLLVPATEGASVGPLAPPTASGAPARGDWNSVLALGAGERLHVEGYTRRTKASGTLVSATDQAITLQTGSGPRTLERDAVRRVSIVNEHRTRWTVLGVAAAVGVLVPLHLRASSQKFCSVGQCISVPREPSFGRTMLTTGVASGVSMPFVWLARNRIVYERR